MSEQTPPPPPSYGAPVAQPARGDHPRTTLILVLGILSLVCCGLFAGIPAVVMGKKALAEIDASGGAIGGRGNIKAGYICGWISIVISVIAVVLYAIIAVVAISTGGLESTTTGY